MSDLPARNRVIYQSEALFISPDTTGHHLYYMPPENVKSAAAVEDCLVKGHDLPGNAGNELIFNACLGGLVANDTAGSPVTGDFKYRTFACNTTITGNGLAAGEGTEFSGKHPVLWEAGFRSLTAVPNEKLGLQYLSPTNDKPADSAWGTSVRQLKRVQNANYSFTINRQDVNQFGQLARIDSVILESPTVSIDFSYYLTDGENERLLGMVTDGQHQSLSGIMTRSQNDYGNNFFILTVPEGKDAIKGDISSDDENKTVISAGNSYITDYSIEGSVGSFPTASVSVEALNIKSDVGVKFKNLPAVDSTDGTKICDTCFLLPEAISGDGTSVLKPGDITIDLQDAGLLSKQMSGDSLGYGAEDKGSAHIQSFTLSTPMGRTALQRLGKTYAFAKEIDFPVTCTLSVNALVSDLKDGDLVDLICGGNYDLKIKIQDPACVGCDANASSEAMVIDFKQAVLDSESFSSAIGDNKTVDLTFSTQIGGPEDSSVGVFISGKENVKGPDTKFKSFPTVQDTGDGSKFYEYGHLGTSGYGFGDTPKQGEIWSTEVQDSTKLHS
tara:strand:- start:3105 stop:4772 length:1668 start_codon:yes stop_codon:yes gene_type:complete